MQEFIDFVMVDGNVLSIANLTSFFGFALILASIVLICHTFLNGRNYR